MKNKFIIFIQITGDCTLLIKILLFILQSVIGIDPNALKSLVGFPSDQGITSSLRGHTHIEAIDVKCDSTSGMLVTIDFEEPFSGVVYSQGYFNDPKCR